MQYEDQVEILTARQPDVVSPTAPGFDIERLKRARDAAWAEILRDADWPSFILSGQFDRRLYGIFLLETYHYVSHNPRHQALVATSARTVPFRYLKFCYQHAEEETGHEMMALHDLQAMGAVLPERLPLPAPATETFIAYLYWISSNGNPLRRLGYSFWAEDSYGYIGPLVGAIRDVLGLRDQQMTFIVSHATIDEEHARTIEEMISSLCTTREDWESVETIMQTTLRLQSDMLSSVVRSYLELRDGDASRYGFLDLVGQA